MTLVAMLPEAPLGELQARMLFQHLAKKFLLIALANVSSQWVFGSKSFPIATRSGVSISSETRGARRSFICHLARAGVSIPAEMPVEVESLI